MNPLENTEPKAVFKWFYEISQIPRGSGNEQAISDFLVKFAKERNLEVYQDKALNVIIKKAGTAGYENSPTVILQGHMDMVPEKTTDSPHDFLKDPIKFVVKGDMLYADNTTLGGDDGIAVAYCLALLDSENMVHPPLEILITTNEETGMDGAMALTDEHLEGKRLVNIDSEVEGQFLVSCAGGANAIVTFDIETEALQNNTVKVSISNLLGGHSGVEIDKQRANAVKILSRILSRLKQSEEFNIVEILGGSKHNAIAKNAHAIISVKNIEKAVEILEKVAKELKDEYQTADKDMCIKVEKYKTEISKMFGKTFSDNLIDFMMLVPEGVQYWSMDIDNLVQTSLNTGVLEVIDNKLQFTYSVRSSSKSALDEVLEKIKIATERCSANFEVNSEYPAWEYSPVSPLRDIALETFKEVFNKDAEVCAIHAGLECGLLKEVLPEADAISFGPNLYDVHTPDEHLDIPSAQRMWEFLLAYLKKLK